MPDKWDITNLEEGEKTVDGWTDGSETTKVMYLVFMAIGTVMLALLYPLLLYNERKRLNTTIAWDIVQEYLFVAPNGGETAKENNNRLVFA